MANITLHIPDELKQKMDARSDVKWSDVFRKVIISKVEQLKKFEAMTEGGEL